MSCFAFELDNDTFESSYSNIWHYSQFQLGKTGNKNGETVTDYEYLM